ncbi:MAG TPA: hypothetical protein VJ623_06830 [Holophagaceae bacterium]|nr:hypothetical protein [Holophagaceae bacterium]
MTFFHRYALREGMGLVAEGPGRGLMPSFSALEGPGFQAAAVHPEVVRFYERTSDFKLDVWSDWSLVFKPFGHLLAWVFSRRIQQLNVPLNPLETRLGMTSQVLNLLHPDGSHAGSAWVRESVASGDTIYAGCYSTCQVPGFPGTCVKVAFPLPNGFALVVMRAESHPDGSLTIRSEGKGFGDPGFYFFVEESPGQGWARYVGSMKESINVYVDAESVLRADHRLNLWGRRFLNLHYRMTPTT